MIYACNWYQIDRQDEQKSDPWQNFIFYLKIFGGKFKICTSVSYYTTNKPYRSFDSACNGCRNNQLDEQDLGPGQNVISF